MKVIIDIPEDMYNDANILMVKDLPELKKIIANGIPVWNELAILFGYDIVSEDKEE